MGPAKYSYSSLKSHWNLLHEFFLKLKHIRAAVVIVSSPRISLRWVYELCGDTRVAETACVGSKALWAEVCGGGSTVLSQPVWHREVALSFTAVASFCQLSVSPAFLMQSLSPLREGKLERRKVLLL